MNDQKLDKKVRKDAEKVQKDLSALAKDGAARLNRFEDSVSVASSKAKKDLTKQVEGSVSQLSKGIDKATGNAAKTLAGTSAKLKKNIGHRFSYFTKHAQEIAVEVPKDLDKKVSGFPWAVVITIGLAVGFVLGLLLQPSRRLVEPVQI
jgi:ElaB/YqjD/DUF883 family membrane-anchored ribosome-binding protein